jgi:glycosyltransferase involved in cell wall biosynthesis
MTHAPVRVLHLIDSGGPGGAETIFVHLASRLEPERWESHVSVPREGWVSQALEEQGLEPIVIPSRGRVNLRYLSRLVRLIKRRRIGLIHTHLFGAAVYGGVAARLCRIPVVSTLHGEPDLPAERREARLRYPVLRFGRGHVVLVSKSLERSFHARERFPQARTTVIHNGIDGAVFHPGSAAGVRESLGLTDEQVLVGAVGNFRPAKGLEVFVEAAGALAERDARYRFVIAGERDAAIFPRVQDRVRELGLEDRLHVLGFRSDIGDVFRALDVYVSSSHREGFSLTTVQALASGVSVVATRSGGPEEILEHNDSGLLVPVGNPKAIADAVHRVVTDPALASRLSKAGLARARDFSLERMLGRYEELYSRLLG